MRFKGLYSHTNPDNQLLSASIQMAGMTDEQREIQRYQDCYHGRLFVPERKSHKMYPWGTRWDDNGRGVSEKRWKPNYQSSLPKKIVHTHVAMLFGEDAFPDIQVTATSPDIYTDLTPDPNIEDPKDARQAAANAELQALLDELLEQVDIYSLMESASQDSLTQGTIPVLFSAYGGEFCHEVLDSKWTKLYCDDKKRPKTITRLVEEYVIRKEVRPKVYEDWLHRREVDEVWWRVWEHKLDDNDQAPKLTNADLTEEYAHNLGLCPVIEIYKPDRRSIFADEIVDNIQGFIRYDNDIKASIRRQLDPQPYMLVDEEEDGDLEDSSQDNSKPLEPHTVWPLPAREVGTFSTQGSHEIAVQDRDTMRSEILESCFIVEIPEKNQQSGKAVGLRLMPMKSAVSSFRRSMGRGGLMKICMLLLKMVMRLEELGQQVTLPAELRIPKSVKGVRFIIALDWGAIVPPDEDDKAKSLQNAVTLKNEGLASKKRCISYIASMFGIEDVDAEILLIEADKAQEAELLVAAQNQLFGAMNP